MKAEIVAKTRNNLMERDEVVFKVEHEGEASPKRKELLELVCAKLGKPKNVVAIQKIHTLFGLPESSVHVNVYDNPETLMKTEPKHVLKRYEEKVEEKSEEVKEEKKVEEKKE